jgi:hypothetical protein
MLVIDKQFLAGVLSVLAIVAIVALQAESVSLTGNVALDATMDAAPREPLQVTTRINGIADGATITVTSEAVTLPQSESRFEILSVVLDGSSSAERATFSVGVGSAQTTLTATQQASGEWMALVTPQALTTLRAQHGAGWYTFSGEAVRGSERSRDAVKVFIP